MLRLSTLQWVAASVRLPMRVFSAVAIAPMRWLYLAVVPRGFARRKDGTPRRLGSLVTEVENHVGYGCASAWWLPRGQAQAHSDEPVVAIMLRGRPARNGRR